jgi:hypothetical protein
MIPLAPRDEPIIRTSVLIFPCITLFKRQSKFASISLFNRKNKALSASKQTITRSINFRIKVNFVI